MFRLTFLRRFAVLVLSLALATPLCEAASRGSAPDHAGRTSPASFQLLGVWEWVTSLWAKAGCGIDPNGACAPSPTPPGHSAVPAPSGSSADAGCGIDPGGRTCGGSS